MDFSEIVQLVGEPLLFVSIGFFGVIGLTALISPWAFKVVAARLDRTVDSQKLAAYLDKEIKWDGFLYRHIRLLGAAVVTVVACLGVLYTTF